MEIKIPSGAGTTQMSIYRNSFIPDISYIICSYLQFIKILFKGVKFGFNTMDMISPVLELLFLSVPGENITILLIKLCYKFILYCMSVICQVTIDQ